MDIPINSLIDAFPDGVLLIGSNGLVTASNGAARDMLQLNPQDLIIGTVIRQSSFNAALAAVRGGGTADPVDFEIHSRPPRLISATISKLGEEGEMLVVLRDLTREQAIEKMRSDFVANASHEMRTPLATIIGTIETLMGPAKNDVKAREMFLVTMLGQAQRMKRLIDDLLTLSRIELNAHVRPNARVSLLHIARQAKGNLQSFAAESKMEVSIVGDADVYVAGDADELLQVVQNLLENALKYGSAGGRATITCKAERDVGILAVRDFGNGIAEVHLPRLTERFYRVSTQESRQRGGTGLGLAIVKHILLRHRSRLDITSRVGEGSTFSFAIPLYKSMI